MARPPRVFISRTTAGLKALAEQVAEVLRQRGIEPIIQTGFFITESARDGRNTYGTFSQWDQPADPARGLKQAIEAIKFEITSSPGSPPTSPTPPSATCSSPKMGGIGVGLDVLLISRQPRTTCATSSRLSLASQ